MKEEPDPARPAELAKLAAKGEEVEVLDPDQVAGPQEVYEGGGVLSVYAAVHPVAVMANGGLVGEAVKDRPEGAVGEDVVEALNFVPGKGDGGQTHTFDLGDGSRCGVSLPVGCSVPAHPDAALGLEEGPQATHESTDGKVASFLLAGRRGYGRGPIRDYYYPAFATHDRSNCRIPQPVWNGPKAPPPHGYLSRFYSWVNDARKLLCGG